MADVRQFIIHIVKQKSKDNSLKPLKKGIAGYNGAILCCDKLDKRSRINTAKSNSNVKMVALIYQKWYI